MKDKIIQITGVELHTLCLTELGRLLDYSNATGEWCEIEVDLKLLNMEDGIPRFDFGKHKGEPIVDAPESYLAWCREKRDDFNWFVVDGKLTKENPNPGLFSYTDKDKPAVDEEAIPF